MKKSLKQLKKDLALQEVKIINIILKEVAIIGGQRSKAELKKSLNNLEIHIKDILKVSQIPHRNREIKSPIFCDYICQRKRDAFKPIKKGLKA